MRSLRSKLLISFSVLAFSALAAPAWAATDAAQAPVQLAMAGAPETVIVTGARIVESVKGGTPLIETPQNIQVLPADLLRDQDATILTTALRNVAGVMPGGYYSAYDYFRIRGFDASGYVYQDNLPFDNGVQINAELYGLEQVEIVKGPASSLYGAGSLGGLVNLVSKRPQPETFLTVGASYGSFDSYDFHLDGNAVLFGNPDVQGRLVALKRYTGSFSDYTKGNDRYYVAPSLTLNFDDDTALTLLASYQHDNINMNFPLTYTGAVVPGPTGTRYPITRYIGEPGRSNMQSSDRYAIGYGFHHRFNEIFSFDQDFRYAYTKNFWDRLLYPAYLGADQRTLYRYPYSTHSDWTAWAIDSRLTAAFNTGPVQHTLLFGIDYNDYSSTYRTNQIDYSDPASYLPIDLYNPVYGLPLPAQPNFSIAQELSRDLGVYVQDHAKLGNFTLTFGGRWDWSKAGDAWSGPFTAHKDHKFVPRVGVTYEFLPRAVVYGSYSESFRPQSGSDFSGTSLAPETGQQWEAGIKAHMWDDRLTLTASLYQLTRQNVATSDAAHPNFSVVTGEQRSRGFELDARAQLTPGWQAILTYAYVDAKVTKDNVIPIGDHPQNAPPTSIGLWTKYELQDGPLKGLAVGGSIYHYASQTGDLPNTFKLPQYTLVGGLVAYDFGPFVARVNVNNIFNKRYFTGSYNNVYVQPGDPRNYTISIDWKL